MIIARELVDELKKIKDFDITYKSDDNSKYIAKLKELIS